MNLANEAAAITFRVLDKCSEELKPAAPWRWQCLVLNGTRLPIAASFEEGFLHLACRPASLCRRDCEPERVLERNRTLAGGVKLAVHAAFPGLALLADIVVLEEKQLLDRVHWALEGFHDGCLPLQSPDARGNCAAMEADVDGARLGELLREVPWACKERGSNDFSVELDADASPGAQIRMSGSGVVLSVELLRAEAATSRRALSLFLLTAGSALRLVRAYAEETESGWGFGMQVHLPAAPAMEEIDHALGALSIAHRMCSREANVLLNDAVARCYLAARATSTTHDHPSREEN